MQRLPLHPRLSAILLAAAGAREAAVACAVLSERHYQPVSPGQRPTTTSDLLSAVERERDLPHHVLRTARALQSLVAEGPGPHADSMDESTSAARSSRVIPIAWAAAGRPGSPRVLLSSGHGAVVGPESGVRDGEFLIALDVTAGRPGEAAEARIRMASTVDRSWLAPTHTRVEHAFDQDDRRRPRACRATTTTRSCSSNVRRLPNRTKSRVCSSTPTCRSRCPMRSDQLLRRLRFAGLDLDVRVLAERAARGVRTLE